MGSDAEGTNFTIDPETYLSIELTLNNTIVQVKRKRIEI